jgi:hypothetical protein
VKWGRRKWNPQKRWITVNKPHETKPVPIVADAALALGAIGDGRLIPLVIVDTTERPDLEELIRVQQYVPAGDVTVQWGEVEGRPENVALMLSFTRPMQLFAILEFNVVKQGSLVDQIMSANGLYIQAGRPGDRFVHNTELPKLIVEIPDTGVRDLWDDKFYRQITTHMQQEYGLGRQQAKRTARQFITEWRQFGKFRMPIWPPRERTPDE